jgi:hypothetical protein
VYDTGEGRTPDGVAFSLFLWKMRRIERVPSQQKLLYGKTGFLPYYIHMI